MWQHLKLSDVSLGAREPYSLVVEEDVKKSIKQTNIVVTTVVVADVVFVVVGTADVVVVVTVVCLYHFFFFCRHVFFVSIIYFLLSEMCRGINHLHSEFCPNENNPHYMGDEKTNAFVIIVWLNEYKNDFGVSPNNLKSYFTKTLNTLI